MSTRPDERPPVWVGHVSMRTNVLDQSHAFMVALGLRPVGKDEDVAVLELRGGTHLVLLRTDEELSGAAPFDLMVEDLEATQKRLAELGLSPSPIVSGRIHRSFTVRDPSGQDVAFNSSHVSGRPV
jgi:catechol 2,3-dioxygenase-like lactoylglutathione lyase family enzyme